MAKILDRAKRQPPYCGTRFGVKIWCNTDPCGLICASISWFLVLYGEYVIVSVILLPWLGFSFYGILHTFLFSMFAVLALASHGKAMLTDPGAVPENAMPVITSSGEDASRFEDRKFRTCRRCQTFKPTRAHHCSVCERCILKMDHHCPWVNNCVGLGNHKFFLLFIFYVFMMSLYALLLCFWRYYWCMQSSHCPNNGVVLVVLLIVEAVLFGLFTACMMCDQYSVITTGTTAIDRLKGEKADTLGISEVFGGTNSKFAIHWLLPVEIWFPSSVKEQLLGYVLESDTEETTTELDAFIGADRENPRESVMTKETLEGGWSVEKHVPREDVQIV